MNFLAYYYNDEYNLLKKSNRVMKLNDINKIIVNADIDFEHFMPRKYKEKMILFKINGEKYVFAPKETENK